MKRKPARTVLHEMTGYDEAWWYGFMQNEIRKASNHKTRQTDMTRWLSKLIGRLWATFPSSGEPYDGNMRTAAALSLILAHWYLRVHRAKAMDPRRPIADRRDALAGWLRVATEYARFALDEHADPALFPGQEWENPWHPKARNGTFR